MYVYILYLSSICFIRKHVVPPRPLFDSVRVLIALRGEWARLSVREEDSYNVASCTQRNHDATLVRLYTRVWVVGPALSARRWLKSMEFPSKFHSDIGKDKRDILRRNRLGYSLPLQIAYFQLPIRLWKTLARSNHSRRKIVWSFSRSAENRSQWMAS